MKKVIKGKELYEYILNALNIICDSVASTLGPCGNNVLINNSETTPFITNDGVTIASTIEDENPIINTILEIIKESSLKTNEEVGDGTTTTLVLLKSIMIDGINEIINGKNAFILKNELNNILNELTDKINQLKKRPTKNNLLDIASISSNDKEIGKFIFDIFNKMKNKNAIKLLESNNKTYYEIKKGYIIDVDNISSLYFRKNDKIELKDVSILIIRGYLDNLEQISELINEGVINNKSVVILSEDYNEYITEQLTIYNLQDNKNIYIFKIPDFASRKIDIEEDISFITNSKVLDLSYEEFNYKYIGTCKNVIITKENITLLNDKNLKERIKYLNDKLSKTNSLYEKDFIENRIAMLKNGIAYVYVSANTKTELKEKIMRFEDAVCALNEAKKGIVLGEGITYLKISSDLSNNIVSERIIKNALQKPFETIFKNSGIEYNQIKNKIISNDCKLIYNFETNKLENIDNTKIIDPATISIECLKNAISISSMLLTTNYLVINESIKKDKIEF